MKGKNNEFYMRFDIKPIKINYKSFSKKDKSKGHSKYDIKKYKILNSFINRNLKFKKLKEQNESKTISTIPPKSKDIFNYKNDMPYIPSKEKQKCETNFIQLIKTLMKYKQKNINKINNKQKQIVDNTFSIEDPYKPKGYNYYRYSREHPELSYDNKTYMKTIQDINKQLENQEKSIKERCLSYNNMEYNIDDKYNNKISLNKLNNNTKSNKNSDNNNIKIINNSKSCTRYASNIIENNCFNSINNLNNYGKLKIDIIKANDNNQDNKDDMNNTNCYSLPIINSTEINNSFKNYENNKINKKKFLVRNYYNQSDIFNLKKISDSEQYLFKNKNLSPNNFAERKTSIIEVGWSPKLSKNHSRISIPSVAFNILCPNYKNISPTKKDIDLLNNNNIYKSNLMSEFVDMCKPGDSELRKEFKDKLNSNKNIFHRNNYCSAYNDMHHGYKDLILQAF